MIYIKTNPISDGQIELCINGEKQITLPYGNIRHVIMAYTGQIKLREFESYLDLFRSNLRDSMFDLDFSKPQSFVISPEGVRGDEQVKE